ncbi:MAG: ATP phosphoribosyltransferase [Bacillota bacterium]|nr:MAG: ATP phosphoribosyltransferase [Bacillota bacterium]
MINVALPKGRLGEKVYNLLSEAGFSCREFTTGNRKLVFTDEENGVSYFWVKPADSAKYVELGAADVGFAGKDILTENEPDVYELLDLNLGKCRMCVAAKSDYKEDTFRPVKVATKFVNVAKNYYAQLGRDAEIIKLNGSIELAPILGLSDVIVDIVETGATLKENDLKVFETIFDISTRLIVNKASYKFKYEKINEMVKRLKETIR